MQPPCNFYFNAYTCLQKLLDNKSTMFLYLGNEALSLSKYSPRAFWIFPRRSDKRSSCFWTLAMLTTSITKGDRVTFFIRAKNSVLTLNSNKTSLIQN